MPYGFYDDNDKEPKKSPVDRRMELEKKKLLDDKKVKEFQKGFSGG